jgi:hypothetical protein
LVAILCNFFAIPVIDPGVPEPNFHAGVPRPGGLLRCPRALLLHRLSRPPPPDTAPDGDEDPTSSDDLGVGLHDFTTDDVRAVLLLGKDGATVGFDQRFLAGASSSDVIQSSGFPAIVREEEDINTNTTTLSTADEDHDALVDGLSMFRQKQECQGRKNWHHEDDDQEGTDAQEMYRDIMKGMQDLRIAKDSESKISSRKVAQERQCANEVVDLHTMLIHCAQAVATGDLRGANETLKQIKQHSSLS